MTELSRMYPNFEIAHKQKCATCKYHAIMTANKDFASFNVICQYILVTGRRRPCPANECTVYEAGEPAKTMSGLIFERTL